MHLIIGGAFQGKLDYAKERYGLAEADICICTQEHIDFSKPCVAGIQEYVYGCVLRGEDPVAFFKANRGRWESGVFILRDISGGLVPIQKAERAWREATGRLCQYLAGEAACVSRIFCGLEQRLK